MVWFNLCYLLLNQNNCFHYNENICDNNFCTERFEIFTIVLKLNYLIFQISFFPKPKRLLVIKNKWIFFIRQIVISFGN